MIFSDKLFIDFAPIDHGDITGVARVTLSLIHHANLVQDVFIIRNLESFHQADFIPRYFEVSVIPKGSLISQNSFSAIRELLRELPVSRVLSDSLSNSRILFPLWRPAKRVSTREFLILFDFSAFRFAETHSDETVQRFTQNLEYAHRLGTKCICISNTTKRDAIKFTSIPKENLQVIYCGLNPFINRNRKHSANKKLPDKDSERTINFLFVSTLEPRKRIVETLEWWRQSNYNDGTNHLTIVGGVGWWSSKPFLKELERQRRSLETGTVTFTGYVTEDQMANYFIGASVLIYPSKYEGFGLPVQDSLMIGLPVLAAANSSLLEFDSELLEFVDGNQIQHWDDKIIKLLSRNNLDYVSDLEARYSWDDYLQYILETHH
jgi:glycosyltransferase involved in cell wall biosynthesis